MTTSSCRGFLAKVSVGTLFLVPSLACSAPPDAIRAFASNDGPDRIPNPSVYMVALPVDQPFSDAWERVLLTGTESATLDGVEILGGDDYFSLVGIQVAGEDRRVGSIQFSESYPPPNPGLGELHDGEGAFLTTREVGSLLIVGMKATRDEIGYRSGLRIYYSVGDQQYYSDHPAAVVNCPPTTDKAACEAVTRRAFTEAQGLG